MLGEFDNRLDHRQKRRVAEGDGAEHDVLGQFRSLALDHQHALGGAREHKVELGCFHLVGSRIQHVFAVDVADASAGDRAKERNAGQRQGRRATDHGDHIGIVLKVVAQHSRDHLDLVAEPLWEQWTQRAVDQAAG